jgi:beta-glucanase (GH16 family)
VKAAVAAFCATITAQAAHASTPHDGMALTFEENFQSFTATPGGLPRWTSTLPHGNRTLSNNHEAEFYVDRSRGGDPFVVSRGVLGITAARAAASLPYTSGIITTEHSFAQMYGYFEMRARLPAGRGLWPAFWLLPKGGGWPPEIDIMEMLGQNPRKIYVSLHTRADGHHYDVTTPVATPDLSKDFHVFGMNWQSGMIRWYVDGAEVKALPAPAGLTVPMFMLINLAVGGAGSWPGAPDTATVFPAVMEVSWVRVYK